MSALTVSDFCRFQRGGRTYSRTPVNDAIAKHGADAPCALPDTAYFFPTIYAATGVKVAKLGDLPACAARARRA